MPLLMATTAYTIYSRYDPEKDKERLQQETGQLIDVDKTSELDNETLWREAASAQFLRTRRPPPKFVPAVISYEVGGSESSASTSKVSEQQAQPGNSLSSWYRALTDANESRPSRPSEVPRLRPVSSPIPTTSSSSSFGPIKGPKATISTRHARDKNSWFIQKVIQSEPSRTPTTPSPTLADILAREPPPLPSEPKYTPPVWVEIGPSNRGFMMLQKGGWSEGEALGIGARRKPGQAPQPSAGISGTASTTTWKQWGESLENDIRVLRAGEQGRRGDPANIKERGIIDLTLSDSGSSSDEEVENIKVEELLETHQEVEAAPLEASEDISAHGHTALLTPIATRLKLDRLGIGLKAKTAGPYKTSVKRVTHSATAVAAHRKAAEDARKRKEKFGSGRRGYERQKRREDDRRRDLLAYMNT